MPRHRDRLTKPENQLAIASTTTRDAVTALQNGDEEGALRSIKYAEAALAKAKSQISGDEEEEESND